MSGTRTAELRVEGITKRFGLRTIFSNLNFTLETGDVIALTGSNGSGKSTLMKIMANVAERTGGRVKWSVDGKEVSDDDLPPRVGYVAPYLQLYTEFTPWEHLDLLQRMRGLEFDEERGIYLFEIFGLAGRRNDPLHTYSSGMLQRVKYICALVHDPPFLFIDDPATNNDERGIAVIRELVASGKGSRVTVVATNDVEDLTMCTKALSLERKLG